MYVYKNQNTTVSTDFYFVTTPTYLSYSKSLLLSFFLKGLNLSELDYGSVCVGVRRVRVGGSVTVSMEHPVPFPQIFDPITLVEIRMNKGSSGIHKHYSDKYFSHYLKVKK